MCSCNFIVFFLFLFFVHQHSFLTTPHTFPLLFDDEQGYGKDGQLGHGDTFIHSGLPRKVTALVGKRIVDVKCGGGHTAVVDGKCCFGIAWHTAYPFGLCMYVLMPFPSFYSFLSVFLSTLLSRYQTKGSCTCGVVDATGSSLAEVRLQALPRLIRSRSLCLSLRARRSRKSLSVLTILSVSLYNCNPVTLSFSLIKTIKEWENIMGHGTSVLSSQYMQ